MRTIAASLLVLSALPMAFIGFAAWADRVRDTSGDADMAVLVGLGYAAIALTFAGLIVLKRNGTTENDNA